MKFLLDTHILLWASEGSERVPRAARTLMAKPENELVFSVASLWEVAIKASRPRDDFDVDPRTLRRTLIENGFVELPITGEHAVAVASLPPIHNDPFDRLLVAQATVEGITLLTSDAALSRYPGPVRAV